MNMKYEDVEYWLVNKNSPYNEMLKSDEFNVVLHELLSIIN